MSNLPVASTADKKFQGAVYNPAYPGALEAVFRSDFSEADLLGQLLPVLGDLLKCESCFLYLHHPRQNLYRVTHTWSAAEHFPVPVQGDWHKERSNYRASPLLGAALDAEHSVFVDSALRKRILS